MAVTLFCYALFSILPVSFAFMLQASLCPLWTLLTSWDENLLFFRTRLSMKVVKQLGRLTGSLVRVKSIMARGSL